VKSPRHPVDVRPLRADETGLLKTLRLRSLAEAPDSFANSFADASAKPDSYWQEMARSVTEPGRHVMFVAENDAAPVGLAFGLLDKEHAATAHLGGMWVDPAARGLGVGRALVEAVLAWARERGFARVALWVTEGNDAAITLYERTGFSRTGGRDCLASNPSLGTLEMALLLSSTPAASMSVTARPPDTTYGISSDLTGEACAEATALWDHLERTYGLSEARAAGHPHVSYLIGEVAGGAMGVEALAASLAEVTPRIAPLEIEIAGVGLFDGPAPALYLRVVRSEPLRSAHAAVLEATRDAFTSIWPHYLPDAWTPHVTLALRDLAPERLTTVRADLEDRVRPVRTRLETIDVVHVVFPRHVYLGGFALAGGGTPR